MDDILSSTPSDVDQVVIEPDGRWSNPHQGGNSHTDGVTPMAEDDELIEIKDSGTTLPKREPHSPDISLQQTPTQSRQDSTTTSAIQSAKKRSAAQVIDLTGSDEDDNNNSPGKPGKKRNLEVSTPGLLSTFRGNFANGGDNYSSGQDGSRFSSHNHWYSA